MKTKEMREEEKWAPKFFGFFYPVAACLEFVE